MKKILLISVLIVLLLSGCDLAWMSRGYENVVYHNIPPLGLTSIAEVMKWTTINIQYISDEGHYFQDPGSTYDLRTGDCEDFTGIAMYLLHTELGLNPYMKNGYVGVGGHAWVMVNGEWWEPNGGFRCEHYTTRYDLFETYTYAETMYRAAELHRSIL